MLRILVGIASFGLASSASAQSIAPSDWANQRGSLMHLEYWSSYDKKVDGNYVNNAPGYPHCAGVPYHLWGLSDGINITFTVRWSGLFVEDCHSTTVWTGRIKGNRLNTTWTLTTDGGQTITGTDSFTRR
jgi:hypothetical protein